MRLLAVSINGLLDAKNFYPLSLELKAKHSINVDILNYHEDIPKLSYLYDGLIVGSDWNQNSKIVRHFNEQGKKTFLLQSEGMFLNEDQWYAAQPPMTQYACLWGPVHERIFKSRGYRGLSIVTGPPRLDTYRDFKPQLTREQVYEGIGMYDLSKKYILFVGQFFPQAEWGEDLFNAQVSLTEFACKTPNDYYAVVKSHPQEAAGHFFSRRDVCRQRGADNVIIVDSGSHTEAIEISTLIYYADSVVSFSSTVSIEAAFLGKASGIFEGDLESPLSNGTMASLPRVTETSDLALLSSQKITADQIEPFASLFLPGPITGRYTQDAAIAIARFAREPVTDYGRSLVFPLQPESDHDDTSVDVFRTVAIDAHTNLARVIEDVGGISLEKVQYETREAGYYQALHDKNAGYQVNNWLISEAANILRAKPSHVVEIGCGNGRFLRSVAGSVKKVTGIDFAKAPGLIADCPANVEFLQGNVLAMDIPRADVVCSGDVLEHFRPEEVVDVIKKMHESSRFNYHVIACYDDGHSHMTIAPPGWWLYAFRRLSPDYHLFDVRPRRKNPKQLVCVITNLA